MVEGSLVWRTFAFRVRDVGEMEAVIDRIVPFGATNSSIVQSSAICRVRSTMHLGLF